MEHTTFAWKITELERDLSDGYVFRVYFTVFGTASGHTTSVKRSIGLKRPSSDLIPYDTLTEELVVNWIKEAIGDSGCSAICSVLQEALNKQLTPVTAYGIPWESKATSN